MALTLKDCPSSQASSLATAQPALRMNIHMTDEVGTNSTNRGSREALSFCSTADVLKRHYDDHHEVAPGGALSPPPMRCSREESPLAVTFLRNIVCGHLSLSSKHGNFHGPVPKGSVCGTVPCDQRGR